MVHVCGAPRLPKKGKPHPDREVHGHHVTAYCWAEGRWEWQVWLNLERNSFLRAGPSPWIVAYRLPSAYSETAEGVVERLKQEGRWPT